MIVKSRMLCTLVVVIACLPVSGQWQRIVSSGKGDSIDIPSPHALSYFTANPFLRDDGAELCVNCSPEGKAKPNPEYSIRPEVETVGVLAGYRILDVLYYISSRETPDNEEAKWKSILVQVGPDRYREIYHLQVFHTTAYLTASQITRSGSERVLVTMDRMGGSGGSCWEGYWWFDRSGPHPLDFSPLRAATRAKLPKNSVLLGMTCDSLDLKSGRIRGWVQKSGAECNACDYLGEVIAEFRLNGSIVEPVAISFKPWSR